MLHLTYTYLLTLLITSSFLTNSLRNNIIYSINPGFLVPKTIFFSRSSVYCLNEQSSDEHEKNDDINDHFEKNQDNLNIYSNEEGGIKFPFNENEKSDLTENELLKQLGLDNIEHVELSEEDETELQKILNKHIELHKDEFGCSETKGDTEVLKKQLPKKFDINASDDEFEIENYNGKFPDHEEIENFLDPLNIRKVAPEEEFTKRMIGRTYNIFNLPDKKHKTHCIDEARRFLYSLPLNNWNDDEKFVLDEHVKRKRIKQLANTENSECLDDFISPYEVLNSSPSSKLGILHYKSNDDNTNSISNTIETSVPRHIIEYTHYDLLNDLRNFKQSEFASKTIDLSTLSNPLFIRLNDEVSIEKKENVTDNLSKNYLKLTFSPDVLPVYTVWPRSILNSMTSQGKFVEVEDNYMFDLEDDSFKSFKTDAIPHDGSYYSAIILLESELGGADDHRIRDLADELSCISRLPIFIPKITSPSYSVLDRLIKNIQIMYKIEKISIVSFGNSSKFALDYCYERLNGKEYLNKYRGVLTLYEIIKRTNHPLNPQIFDSGDFYEKLQEEKEIERAKRLNPVRPLKNILQCLVFWDARNVNLDKALALGVPLLNIVSGTPVVNNDGISLSLDMLKSWDDLKKLGFLVKSEYVPGVDIFNIMRPGGKVISKPSDHLANNSQTDTNKPIDPDVVKDCKAKPNPGTAFKIALFNVKNSPIYLLPPTPGERDIQEYNRALIYAYHWIIHWTE